MQYPDVTNTLIIEGQKGCAPALSKCHAETCREGCHENKPLPARTQLTAQGLRACYAIPKSTSNDGTDVAIIIGARSPEVESTRAIELSSSSKSHSHASTVRSREGCRRLDSSRAPLVSHRGVRCVVRNGVILWSLTSTRTQTSPCGEEPARRNGQLQVYLVYMRRAPCVLCLDQLHPRTLQCLRRLTSPSLLSHNLDLAQWK